METVAHVRTERRTAFRRVAAAAAMAAGIMVIASGCGPASPGGEANFPTDLFTGSSPWPEIRKERISTLLPKAMEAAGVDAWVVFCRENDNDPMADHVGGENAGGEAAFIFYRDGEGFHSLVYSPVGEATALDELDIHDTVIPVGRGESAMRAAAEFLRGKGFRTIAVNSSASNAQADGLSHTQRLEFERELGREASKLVSSEELVYEWLSVKLPEEVDIMRKAAEVTAAWQIEAYARVVPGVTTDADVARFLKAKMAEYGVEDAWAPDQNPNVNSGADRGHSHATDKVIVPGDVIQTDFGIKVYGRWVSDIQRFAYVLREGERAVPDDMQSHWINGREGGRAAFDAMRPGVRGIDVDDAQRRRMELAGSEPVMWSTGHPVGYVAHDTGPNLGGSRLAAPRPAAMRVLKPGMVFAFDGFHAWTREDGTTKTISVEEMAVITEDGAEYLIPPQQELVLID
jgi:Xaa-Pro dipeptidase